jgi:predicted ABC-type ATPase
MAGPNGAGKGSVLEVMLLAYDINKRDFIDTDAETVKRRGTYNWKNYKATQAEIDAEKDEIIKDAQKSFGFETVLGSERHKGFVERTKMRGYFVQLVYIGLDSKYRSIDRVNKRAQEGRLNIMSRESIVAVFPLSKEHLMDIIPLVDRFDIYDNSYGELVNGRRRPVHCLSGALGKITYERPDITKYMGLIRDVIQNPTLGKKHLHSLDAELDAQVLRELKAQRDALSGPPL